MQLTKDDIRKTERIRRLNLLNSITGIKPANLVGTISGNGQTNLAIFSSVVHLGSDPALMGLILRPTGTVRRDTFENIQETGYYTINQVHTGIVEQAHFTAAKFEKSVSEFDICGFTPEYQAGFPAPFVAESRLKIGLQFQQAILIEANGTTLIIGSVEHLILPDEAVDSSGHILLDWLEAAGISGLNTYYRIEKFAQYPYARPEGVPDFSKKKD
ncbi:MAG: flavin oxidoreductase [Bacteroidetes bacterium]|nr:MAG: flavin oxidoreductase [Bacteroidota bacterium]